MQPLKDIINVLETFAPLGLQEEYDNSGLVCGNPEKNIIKAIVALDLTPHVLLEAIAQQAQLIIVHHPPIFKPLKRISYSDPVSVMLMEAIKEDIAIYACHTNLDNVLKGVNGEIATRLNLQKKKVLNSMEGTHKMLITFVPIEYAELVRQALFNVGAGAVGAYSECSFSLKGNGTFRADEGANPWVGKIGERHTEQEERIELIFPTSLEFRVIDTLLKTHPYETVAYNILTLNNKFDEIGAGVIGILPEPIGEIDFLRMVKSIFKTGVIRHNELSNRVISKVAICGGSGKSLINNALKSGADVFLTADLSYHDFFIPGNKLLLADIGHYESEQFTSDRLVDILIEKFPNFAVLKSGVNTNPVNYFL